MKFPAFAPIDFRSNIGPFDIIEVSLSKVIPDPKQPRKNFDPSRLEELVISIKQHGVIQPIIVKISGEDQYQIIAGERRWRAAKMAGLQAIPAIVQNNDSQENVAISLIENIQREELNPIELAEAFFRLSTEYQLSHESIAAMVGKSRATVTNLLRLLNLSKYVRELLISGDLEMGHARALLTLSADDQIALAQKIVEKNLTVRDSERLVQMSKSPKDQKQPAFAMEVDRWVQQLSDGLSSKVSVNINEKGEGRVVIHFASPDEMNWLTQKLVGEEV